MLFRLLGTIHGLLGIVLLVAPLASARLFRLDAVLSMAYITRMLGCRDLVLGGAILASEKSTQPQRRALLVATNSVNFIDFLAAVVSYMDGSLAFEPWAFLSTGAAVNLSLGLWESTIMGCHKKGTCTLTFKLPECLRCPSYCLTGSIAN